MAKPDPTTLDAGSADSSGPVASALPLAFRLAIAGGALALVLLVYWLVRR
jgi:hypothetical protein